MQFPCRMRRLRAESLIEEQLLLQVFDLQLLNELDPLIERLPDAVQIFVMESQFPSLVIQAKLYISQQGFGGFGQSLVCQFVLKEGGLVEGELSAFQEKGPSSAEGI